VENELTSKWWGPGDLEEALLFPIVCDGSCGWSSTLFPARGGESKNPRISSTLEMFLERCGGLQNKRKEGWCVSKIRYKS
jgi:hypothetical protein